MDKGQDGGGWMSKELQGEEDALCLMHLLPGREAVTSRSPPPSPGPPRHDNTPSDKAPWIRQPTQILWAPGPVWGRVWER